MNRFVLCRAGLGHIAEVMFVGRRCIVDGVTVGNSRNVATRVCRGALSHNIECQHLVTFVGIFGSEYKTRLYRSEIYYLMLDGRCSAWSSGAVLHFSPGISLPL